jgi:hypothetical protein
MILRGSALLLTEAVIKFNRLIKYQAINTGDRFIYGGDQEMSTSKNRFMEADTLRQPPPKMAYF